MAGKRVLIGLAVAATVLASPLPGGANLASLDLRDLPEKDIREEITRISLQVSALQVLSLLKSSGEQLKALGKIAQETTPKRQPRKQTKVSERHRRILTELRDALVAGNDDRAAALSQELKDQQEKDPVELDDGIEIVGKARGRVVELLRLYNSRQVAGYLGSYGDDFPDPAERLLAGFEDAREVEGDDWEKGRKQLAETLGWLVAGCDAVAAAEVEKAAAALLDKAHDLRDEAYERQRADIEAAGRRLVGQVDSLQVIRHFMERELAELLSNPELPAILEERMKRMKAEED
jgi:hypothetical protein